MINWNAVWDAWFGCRTWLGVDLGFWISLAVVLVIVIAMNIVVWRAKPLVEPMKSKN